MTHLPTLPVARLDQLLEMDERQHGKLPPWSEHNDAYDTFFRTERVPPSLEGWRRSVEHAIAAGHVLTRATPIPHTDRQRLASGLQVALAQSGPAPDLVLSDLCGDPLEPMARWIQGHQLFVVLVQAAVIAHHRCVATDDPAAASAQLRDAAALLDACGVALELTGHMSRTDYDGIREAMTSPPTPPGFSGLWSADHALLLRSLAWIRDRQPALAPDDLAPWRAAIRAVYERHIHVCERVVGGSPSLRMMDHSPTQLGRTAHAHLTSFERRALRLGGEPAVEPAAQPSRARDVPGLRARLGLLHTPQSIARVGLFRPRPDDVFIVTYPKSGTTWLQQIVHGMRTAGSMDFDEISAVVPWLETCFDLDLDPEVDQPGGFRAFKSHCSAAEAPPGVRFVVSVRDPRHVLVSFYRFLEGWMFEPGAIDLPTFTAELFAQGSNSGRYWEHLVGWWGRRAEPGVLLLAYEDMVADLPAAVDRIAAHLGIALDPGTRALVVAQSGREFMQEHAHRFDDHLLREARNAACGLPPGGSSAKVRPAEAPLVLSPEVGAHLQRMWAEVVAPATGHPDYTSLRRAMALGA
jgi:hypothetical protein